MGAKRNILLRTACIQINAGDDWKKNFRKSLQRAKEAAHRGARLITLPENFLYRGKASLFREIAEKAAPSAIEAFKDFAKKNGVTVLLGSMIERSANPKKYFNTSILVSEKGKVAAAYRKIHLFDIHLKNLNVLESRYFVHGAKVVTGRVGDVRAGLSICYDLRFPELFRALRAQGAGLFFVPANFTYETGKAHWEVLLRTRAIENQAFVVAPAQIGTHPSTGIRSFGTSLIIDPWGCILAKAGTAREEVIVADLDFRVSKRLSLQFPVLRHRRL